MKGKKKILLAVVLVLVMAVGITSIVVIRNRNKTVVKVFPVSMLNIRLKQILLLRELLLQTTYRKFILMVDRR